MMRPLILSALTVLALALPAGAQTPTPPVPDTQPAPQPPETKTTPLQIYASLNGQQAGPFSAQAITEMAAQGQIDAQTLVWSGELNMTGWQPAGQVPAIAALLKAPSPSPGPPPLPDSGQAGVTVADPATYLSGAWSGERGIVIPGLHFPAPCTVTMQFHSNGHVTGGCSLSIAPPGLTPVTGEMRIDTRWTAEAVAEGRILLRQDGDETVTARLPSGKTETGTSKAADQVVLIVLSPDQMKEEETGIVWSRSGGRQ